MKNLQYLLLLYGNNIKGRIPDLAGEIGGNRLIAVDLSNNSITGLPQFQWDGINQLSIQSNMIQGPFPPSICDMSNLQYLDLSNNSFDGVIPQCIGNISSLGMLHLGANLFNGTIPNACTDYRQLTWFILNKNQFEGEIPTSLSKCRNLQILDLGNNHLYGTFPGWLSNLPRLQVIVLKSNNFHGPIETSSKIKLPFPLLRVLDLSHNQFAGHLPTKYFQYFNAMKDVVRTGSTPEYLQLRGKYYFVIVGVKGHQLPFPQLLVDYTIIDLSVTNLKEIFRIPLALLTHLKCSTYPITTSMVESHILWVVSWRLNHWTYHGTNLQVTGEIPRSLSNITNLAVLDFSQNHIVGRIPQGTQFNTFEGRSFGGNLGLCGCPLTKHCEHPRSPQLEVTDGDGDEDESGFTWKVVMLGYGCGTLPGLVITYVV
ncbi:unnamed protein product [Lactuca virosa]|uniref:Leucine-rich repeat-containing N-terminal plant-type domain-containing protein n=1 Tax=Lactuca virosa TaxID=75947 RepID=A0AAU9NLH2_9ASTR|nr:unnamed protein product [Lactuca virosa]